ncbi:MAG: DUF4011 domain-containing protein, partial [Candidatus Electrothrix sp. ATG1]|nr:DUF4011 domain-containing protein [Candidatus Electrothrix sp. ATG1]
MAPEEQARPNNDVALNALENLRLRLLDLTARNRLVNFRHTKNASLRVIDELPNQLTEKLLSDKELRFLPVPYPTLSDLITTGFLKIEKGSGKKISFIKRPTCQQLVKQISKKLTAQKWAEQLGLRIAYDVPKPTEKKAAEKHSDSAIQVALFPDELEVRLTNLMQSAESGIQEMGTNILYLAFGFLEWYENTTNNARPRLAPLFLVPAHLQKGRLNQKTKIYEYTISYSGEDILPNLS